MCLGHTHRPSGAWDDEPVPRFTGNSGSWCPAFRDPLCTDPVLPRRPLLLLTSEGEALCGRALLVGWGELAPEAGATRGVGAV